MTDGIGKFFRDGMQSMTVEDLTISLLFKKTRIKARSTEQTISGLLS
jgi:hypothetical protein